MHDRTTHITLSPLTVDGTRLEPVAVSPPSRPPNQTTAVWSIHTNYA